ncbi:hypothetical protein [Planomonospora parontospora]|uniref:hypothetical protein n=1 Tax=Planomonospora parontospora TaxID=58119 RepID=UPI00167031A5|nr:hypothetical protein [Planomonospora parontospora]GGL27952.1 hypothetical protein GCM10014719_31830 [Planomonospora parontospora subsp. antibiotica]GII16460.1 hypothetical protein Ppa05_31860 [Planomonospora parontospora subsp. antibiotica]
MAEPDTSEPVPETGDSDPTPETGPGAEDDHRPLHRRLAEERHQNRVSAENLDALYADTVIYGDRVSGASHRFGDHGTVNTAGRDQYFFGLAAESETVRTGPLPTGLLNAVRHCHVATASYRILLSRLRDEHVLLLRSGPQRGQPTTAVAALLRWASDEHRVNLLHLGTDPFRLEPSRLRTGTGYILDARDAERCRLDTQVLLHLCTTMERIRGRVVVLVDSGFPEHDWLVDHQPPAAEQVFVSWLTHALEESRQSDASEQAEKAAVCELVRERLAEPCTPQTARNLACQVARGLARGESVEEILAVSPEQRRQQIQKLLSEGASQGGRCFAIASAVLQGSSAAVVSHWTIRLATLVQKELARQTTADRPREAQTWERLSDWTGQGSIAVESTGRSGDGQVVRFRLPESAGTALRLVWEEQPTIRQPLLSWLGELTAERDALIRMKAAQVIGLLATYDFPAVEERFLDRWRKDGQHDLAAWSLGSTAKDPGMAARVHGCLREWAGGTPNSRSVVIRVYGSWIGVEWPEEALRELGRITGTLQRGSSFADEAARSIWQIHQPQNSAKVLSTLAGWAAHRDVPGRHRAAALAFVRLVAPSDGRPPFDLVDDPDVQPELITLWRHALDQGVTVDGIPAITPEAWEFLGDWLRGWDTHPRVRSVVASALTRPPAHLVAPLRFHLRMWRRLGAITAETAAYLDDLLERN